MGVCGPIRAYDTGKVVYKLNSLLPSPTSMFNYLKECCPTAYSNALWIYGSLFAVLRYELCYVFGNFKLFRILGGEN